ncbi:phosphatase PAP2 family protein [Acidithiobacillus ferrivorans]|uniref:phosphatase PAP2 family protein n=1 Tax=Acidithiobacillus ferrivorans TaxID=160808 RepID=UPI00031CAD1B|nr:phosphatase PAP2 family protein [Acidithiobacillus ferrivorans]MBU2767860.1 phosphatase PAP2 family protein [Acidithiobacillus ferrivorans]MBU2850126.1 phosphatase PAP2 family protein [Acidithiobacillus ferrivorans]OFA17662.1 phosphoesterase [Acidithiobacillus ferrivorans]
MRGPQRWELLALLLLGLGVAALLWLYAGDFLAGVILHRMALQDTRWEAEILQFRDPAWQPFWAGVTRLGGPDFLPWLVALMAAACFAAWRFFDGILLVSGTVVFAVLVQLVKVTTARARPPTAIKMLSPAFPSGHVSLSLVVYGLLALYLLAMVRHRGLRLAIVTLLAALVGAISWSRLVLGAHWPSDVLGAWLLSGLWLGLLWAVWQTYHHRHPQYVLTGARQIWSSAALGLLGIAGLAVIGHVLSF